MIPTELPGSPRQDDIPHGSKGFAMLQRVLHVAFVLAVCGYLFYRLSKLGWYNVLASLPVSPWFYVLFVIRFLSLPLFEIVIYRRFWRFSVPRSIPVFLRKRVYNHALMDYSGEAYFYLWARRNSQDPETRTFSIIKDVNIASAIVSIVVMIGLLLIFAGSSSIHQLDRFLPSANVYLWAFAAFSTVSLSVLIAFRRRVVFLSATDMAAVSSLHVVRLAVVLALQALQWWTAIPAAPLMDWLFFLTLYMVVGRLPFVPSKDLTFLAAAVAFAGAVPAQETAVSAMFLANLALYQIANLLIYAGTSFKSHAMFIGTAEKRQSHRT